MNIAAAFAITSAAAQATAAILVVLQAVGGNAGTVRGDDAAHLLEALFKSEFGAVQLGGALKDAVGKLRQVFLHARDTEVQIDLVVVGRDVAVTDRPVFAVAIVTLGFEIIIREAKREASPDICLAPGQRARTHA